MECEDDSKQTSSYAGKGICDADRHDSSSADQEHLPRMLEIRNPRGLH
jgi:hypothetical protein